MDMMQLKEKAKQLGIRVGKMKKEDVVRAIQNKEGNFPCFGTAKDYCNQLACAWRKGCLPSQKLGKTYEQKKNAYLNKIKTELEALTTRLAALKQRSQKAMAAGKAEAHAEIQPLEKKVEELREKAHNLAAAGEDAWDMAKQGVDKAWEELRRSAKKVLEKFD